MSSTLRSQTLGRESHDSNVAHVTNKLKQPSCTMNHIFAKYTTRTNMRRAAKKLLKEPHARRAFAFAGKPSLSLLISEGDISQWSPESNVESAVVTSSNEALMGNTKYANWWKFAGKKNVDAFIHARAGPELLCACLQVPEIEAGTGRRCRVGDCVITAGFELPVDWVIHAVGPEFEQQYLHQRQVKHDISQASALLRKTYLTALRLSHSKHVQSLAMPAVGVGVGNFPGSHFINQDLDQPIGLPA